MVSVLIGTGISILLDPVFIFVFGWGVRGAAAANVLAQLVSTIWIVLFLSSGFNGCAVSCVAKHGTDRMPRKTGARCFVI
ncbi:hypothetical protein Blolo01_06300 [Bifidobacterium longum subsp. longum]|nr:hypothetical protein Blolo01_06300 [Bifidobacterium longum subsp. longum]